MYSVVGSNSRLPSSTGLTTEQEDETLEIFELMADREGWLPTAQIGEALMAMGLTLSSADVDQAIQALSRSTVTLTKVGFALCSHYYHIWTHNPRFYSLPRLDLRSGWMWCVGFF